eukprot:Opistho-2@26445
MNEMCAIFNSTHTHLIHMEKASRSRKKSTQRVWSVRETPIPLSKITLADGAGNELLHDFVGASVNALDTCIGKHAGGIVLPHVSVSSVELHALVGDLALDLSDVVLNHGGTGGIQLLAVVEVNAAIEERASDDKFCLHLGKLEAVDLERVDRGTKSLALGNILAGGLKQTLRGRMRKNGNNKTLLGKLLHEVNKSAVFLSNDVGDRDADVVKEELARVLCFEAKLVELAALCESLAIGLHHDEAGALGALCGIRLAHDDDVICHCTVGDERLLAVDHIVVAIAHRRGLHSLEIASSTRLSHGNGANLSAIAHRRQPRLLLRLRSVVEDVWHDDVCVEGKARSRDLEAALLLHHNGRIEKVDAGAAVLLGEDGAQKTQFTGLLPALT